MLYVKLEKKRVEEMKKIELLAPAGSFEKAKIAFLYGADAVYAGTPKSEVSDNDLFRTIEYAHNKRQTCVFSYKYICVG